MDLFPFEQAAVLGQDDSSLLVGDPGDGVVRPVPLVGGIKPEHPQQLGNLADVDINDKGHLRQEWTGQGGVFGYVDRWLMGVDIDPVPGLDKIGEILHYVVHGDGPDLCVRRAERFNDVLDRGPAGQLIVDKAASMVRGEQVLQTLMENKGSPAHRR